MSDIDAAHAYAERHPSASLLKQWVLGAKLIFMSGLAMFVAFLPAQFVLEFGARAGNLLFLVLGLGLAALVPPLLFFGLAFLYRARIEEVLAAGDASR